jgi:hypothetical protein
MNERHIQDVIYVLVSIHLDSELHVLQSLVRTVRLRPAEGAAVCNAVKYLFSLMSPCSSVLDIQR